MSWRDWYQPGTRVELTRHHSWPGRRGVVEKHTTFLGRPALMIRLEEGGRTAVLYPREAVAL